MGMLFVIPSALILLVVVVAPILSSFGISFTNYSILGGDDWEGTKNYQQLFSDPTFAQALEHTAIYTFVAVPVQTILALVLAEVIAKRYRNRWGAFVRSVLFIPVIASLVISGVVWRALFDTDHGAINAVLALIGVPGPDWFGEPNTALIAVIIVTVWKNTGFFLIIYYAGIMNVPVELYEASALDGAGPIKQLIHITIPQLNRVTALVVILGTIWSFQVFDLVYTLTGGGPGGATTTLVMAIYNAAFQNFNMGYASAMAMVLLLIVLVLSIIQRRVLRERKELQ